MGNDGYQELANAIVVQAGKDYMQANYDLYVMKWFVDELCISSEKVKSSYFETLNNGIKKMEETIEETSEFFKSAWYASLTIIDSGYLLKRLNAKVMKNIDDFEVLSSAEQREVAKDTVKRYENAIKLETELEAEDDGDTRTLKETGKDKKTNRHAGRKI